MFSLAFWLIMLQVRKHLHGLHILANSEAFHRCGRLTALFFDGLAAHLVFTLLAPHIFGAVGLDDILGGVLVPHSPGSADVNGGH